MPSSRGSCQRLYLSISYNIGTITVLYIVKRTLTKDGFYFLLFILNYSFKNGQVWIQWSEYPYHVLTNTFVRLIKNSKITTQIFSWDIGGYLNFWLYWWIFKHFGICFKIDLDGFFSKTIDIPAPFTHVRHSINHLNLYIFQNINEQQLTLIQPAADSLVWEWKVWKSGIQEIFYK